MSHAQRLFLMHRQGLCCPRQILDLTPIDVTLGEIVVISICQGRDFHAFDILHFFNEHLPHRLLGFEGQLAVTQ